MWLSPIWCSRLTSLRIECARSSAVLMSFTYLFHRRSPDCALGIAFKGPEGIVLAADSRVTLTGEVPGSNLLVQSHYDNATKLLKVKDHDNVGADPAIKCPAYGCRRSGRQSGGSRPLAATGMRSTGVASFLPHVTRGRVSSVPRNAGKTAAAPARGSSSDAGSERGGRRRLTGRGKAWPEDDADGSSTPRTGSSLGCW